MFTLPSLNSALKKTNNDTRPCNIQGNFDIPEFKFNALADKEVLDMVLTASSRNTGTGSGYQHLIV